MISPAIILPVIRGSVYLSTDRRYFNADSFSWMLARSNMEFVPFAVFPSGVETDRPDDGRAVTKGNNLQMTSLCTAGCIVKKLSNGGSCPFLVFDDFNLDQTVDQLMTLKWRHAGGNASW
jgi:hypothetical protein